jgi:Zn-dependent protease
MQGSNSTGDGYHRVPGAVGVFRVLNVPIRLHFTFLLLFSLLLISGLGGQRSSVVYVLYVGGLLLSVLLHEFGHAVMAKHYGIRTLEVVMFPIGGVARLDRRLEPAEEFGIALAGPLVNVFLAGLCWVLATSSNYIVSLNGIFKATDENLAAQLFFGNLAMAGFNLLPAFPMDGGRILRAILSRFKTEEDSTRLAAWIGRMIAISLALYALFSGHYLLVFAAFFIYIGAAQEAAASLGRALTLGIPVRAAMVKEFHTLSHASTIREAIDMSLACSQQDFPVVHGGAISGILNRNALLHALASEGPDAYIVGVMDRQYISLTPDLDLSAALPVMARSGSCALVMKDEELVGLLTTENLSHFLALRRFGLEPAER